MARAGNFADSRARMNFGKFNRAAVVGWSIFIRHHNRDSRLRLVNVESATCGDQLDQCGTAVIVATVERKRRSVLTLNKIAAKFATLLRKLVRAEIVPRESWEPLLKSQGMKNPTPRMRTLDGFNEGWIDFEGGSAEHFTGSANL